MKNLLIFALAAVVLSACGEKTATHTNSNSAPANKAIERPGSVESPMPTPVLPKDENYTGHGKVTKVNMNIGSIEIDHEAIPEVMPQAMKMEFYVKDKALLNGIKVGDTINFILQYKQATETIIGITKIER